MQRRGEGAGACKGERPLVHQAMPRRTAPAPTPLRCCSSSLPRRQWRLCVPPPPVAAACAPSSPSQDRPQPFPRRCPELTTTPATATGTAMIMGTAMETATNTATGTAIGSLAAMGTATLAGTPNKGLRVGLWLKCVGVHSSSASALPVHWQPELPSQTNLPFRLPVPGHCQWHNLNLN